MARSFRPAARSTGPAILLISTLALGGCHFGTRAQTFGPAQGPEGVHTGITTMGAGWISGELLEVQDTALLVLSDERLVLVPFDLMRSAQFDEMGSDTTISDQEAPSIAARERLRLVSRFPQGVTAELLEELLAAYGQDEVLRVVR